MSITEKLVDTARTEYQYWKTHDLVECVRDKKKKPISNHGQPGSALVAKYWQEEPLNEPDRNGCTKVAWSAAFISWCIRQAEVPLDKFPYSGAHHTYIRWAINNAKGKKQGKLYYGRRVGEYAPKPGDLIAQWRKEKETDPDPDVSYDHQPDGSYYSHCDIVTEVNDSQVLSIGGNVSDKVSESSFALVGGLLKPSKRLICIMELVELI